MIYLFIAIGGALGAMTRFGVAQMVSFPYATLFVNVVGSFLMGIAFVYFMGRFGDRTAVMIMGGFLGAFTTFSAFSLDVLKLVDTGRMSAAIAYAGGSVILSIIAVFAGVTVAKGLWT